MEKKKKSLLMYMHAGSGNHGCEAIVNSLCNLLNAEEENYEFSVLTNDKEEDERYSLPSVCTLLQEQKMQEHFVAHVIYYLYRKVTGDRESFLAYKYKNAGKLEQYDLAISIGGDNYCYDVMIDDLVLSNRLLHRKGIKTILLGCSIEPDLLLDHTILEDLKSYKHIISRESITTKALLDAGITQVSQLPDPAFSLQPTYRPLPDQFAEGNTVGINVSPMIMDYEADGQSGIVWRNYVQMMQYILDTTDYHIALVSHVVWDRNDDRKPVQKLFDMFAQSYGQRVCIIEDGTCQELKGDIARCRFFVGARTHSTIAAYSSMVPTLVAGYSVKSIGIARDLFGTERNYVVDVRKLKDENALMEHFKYLVAHENEMREKLRQVIPNYVEELGKMRGIIGEVV